MIEAHSLQQFKDKLAVLEAILREHGYPVEDLTRERVNMVSDHEVAGGQFHEGYKHQVVAGELGESELFVMHEHPLRKCKRDKEYKVPCQSSQYYGRC